MAKPISVKTPEMDKLSGKKSTTSSKEIADAFIDALAKENELARLKAIAARKEIVDTESARGISSNDKYLGLSSPNGIAEQISAGVNSGLSGLGYQAANVGSNLPSSLGTDYSNAVPVYETRKNEIDAYLARANDPGQRIPNTGQVISSTINNIPEVINPFGGVAANAGYHAIRSLASNAGNIPKAGLAGASNVLGEAAESVLKKGGFVGNMVGSAVENSAQYLGDFVKKFFDRKKP